MAILIALTLSAACESTSESVTAPAQARCPTAVETGAASFPAAGGAGTMSVATPRECAWTAESEAGWLVLGSPAAGQGNGQVQFTVSSNDAPAARTAAIIVNDQRREISQQGRPCEYSLSSHHETVPAAGGDIAVAVTASSTECSWTAAAGAQWLTIIEGGEGRGSGLVRVRVEPSGDPQRSGTLTIAGGTVQIDQGGGCAVSVTPAVIQIGSDGGERVMTVETTSAACAWSAVADAAWITIEGGQGRTGSGTFTVRVAPTGGAQRSSTLRVGSQAISVFQGTGCAVSVGVSVVQVASGGGERAVAVDATSPECTWTAATGASWITIVGPSARAGSGSVSFHVAANAGPQRSGTLSVAGHTLRVDQASGCAVTLSPSSATAPAAGGTAAIDVQVGAGCPWTAAPSQSWITVVSSGSGTGSGRVEIGIAANAGPERSGSVAIGGRTFTLTQASGCSYSIAPATQDAAGPAGGTTVTVSTAAGCPWTADTSTEWLSLSTTSGTGPADVRVTWAANQSPERAGSVRIAGHTFTVTQASSCNYELVPPFAEFGAEGGNGAVLVIVSGPCTWTAASNADWIRMTFGTQGTGDGVVQFVVAANSGPARTGFISIAGRQYRVSQAGR